MKCFERKVEGWLSNTCLLQTVIFFLDHTSTTSQSTSRPKSFFNVCLQCAIGLNLVMNYSYFFSGDDDNCLPRISLLFSFLSLKAFNIFRETLH